MVSRWRNEEGTMERSVPELMGHRLGAESELIEVEDHEDLLVVRLVRPHVRNALTSAVRCQLAELLRDLADSREHRAVVVASHERAFSAGQDLNESADFDPDDIPAWIEEHMSLYRAVLS